MKYTATLYRLLLFIMLLRAGAGRWPAQLATRKAGPRLISFYAYFNLFARLHPAELANKRLNTQR